MTLGEHEQPGQWRVGANTGHLKPTDLAIGLEGEIYVLVGHGGGEPRLLKFDSGGTLLTSWGGQGTAPGEFDTPHSIVVDAEGRVYVTGRIDGCRSSTAMGRSSRSGSIKASRADSTSRMTGR